MNNLVKHIEKAGRGYTFDVLRAKVLFGTKAISKPKYGAQPFGEMDKTKTIKNVMFDSFNYSQRILQEGFGVSIPQLLALMESGDL